METRVFLPLVRGAAEEGQAGGGSSHAAPQPGAPTPAGAQPPGRQPEPQLVFPEGLGGIRHLWVAVFGAGGRGEGAFGAEGGPSTRPSEKGGVRCPLG